MRTFVGRACIAKLCMALSAFRWVDSDRRLGANNACMQQADLEIVGLLLQIQCSSLLSSLGFCNAPAFSLVAFCFPSLFVSLNIAQMLLLKRFFGLQSTLLLFQNLLTAQLDRYQYTTAEHHE